VPSRRGTFEHMNAAHDAWLADGARLDTPPYCHPQTLAWPMRGSEERQHPLWIWNMSVGVVVDGKSYQTGNEGMYHLYSI